MNKIRLIRLKNLQELASKIAENLTQYRAGSFEFLVTDHSSYIECPQEVDDLELQKVDCETSDHKEVECFIQMYEALKGAPPYLARDSRLWVYLTHTKLLNYARKRWPIPSDDVKAVEHIKTHFFSVGARGIERDNAASRLWWMAYLCSRVSGLTLRESLTSFLNQSDVRANIIERPTTSQSIEVFSAVIKKLDESYRGSQELFKRKKFRAVMKELNLLGGVRLLGSLNEQEIGQIVDKCAK